MNKTINFGKRLVLFFVGMTIIQFGVALYLKTNIGSDPMTVFTQGLASTLNKTALKDTSIVNMIAGTNTVTPGVANMIILVVLTAIILLVERKRINIGTLICVVGVGPIIDLGVKVISYFPVENTNLFVKMLLVLLGCCIIAIGFSVLSASNVGVAPNDIIPFIIQDKTKAQYRTIRITMDAVLLIGGYFLGGVVGIGTIISMAATGPFIQMFLPYGEKFVDFLVEEKSNENEGDNTVIA
ncbi:MAG: hypothetical protein E7207_01395 [Clostridium butyricum]|nr:hypothetical protein [Clostridium butyricum]